MAYCTKCGKPLSPQAAFLRHLWSVRAAGATGIINAYFSVAAQRAYISLENDSARSKRFTSQESLPDISPSGRISNRGLHPDRRANVLGRSQAFKTKPRRDPPPAISSVISTPIGASPAYTAAELAGAPVESAAVSPEAYVATLGVVTVDFGPWNLNGEDEVVIRRLPEKVDAAIGATLLGYDLSLSQDKAIL
jgi:hypothetical protein